MITPKEGHSELCYLSGNSEFSKNHSDDTLGFNFSQGAVQFSSDYKKSKLIVSLIIRILKNQNHFQ